jgi:hypothetical protein
VCRQNSIEIHENAVLSKSGNSRIIKGEFSDETDEQAKNVEKGIVKPFDGQENMSNGKLICKTWGDEEHCERTFYKNSDSYKKKVLKNFKKKRRKWLNKFGVECSKEEFYEKINEKNKKEFLFTEHEEEEERVETEVLNAEKRSFDERDYQCDRSAIYHHPDEDGSCLAAVHNCSENELVGRQEHAVECTHSSCDGKTCLISERNQNYQNVQTDRSSNIFSFDKLIVEEIFIGIVTHIREKC